MCKQKLIESIRFLSDPCIPMVRSMVPSICPSVTDLTDVTLADEDNNQAKGGQVELIGAKWSNLWDGSVAISGGKSAT